MQNVLANTLEISVVSLLVAISWQIDLNSHRQADIAITTTVFGVASLLAGFLYHYIFCGLLFQCDTQFLESVSVDGRRKGIPKAVDGLDHVGGAGNIWVSISHRVSLWSVNLTC